MPGQYFGKYTGIVKDNSDPDKLGRLKVVIPAIFPEDEQMEATAALPYGFFFVPEVDTKVWVEFEGGDPEYPIWSGGFWGVNEAPDPAPGPQQIAKKILKTDSITLTLNDLPGGGGVTLEVAAPAVINTAKIEITSAGITISFAFAKIEMTLAGVAINGDALRVLP